MIDELKGCTFGGGDTIRQADSMVAGSSKQDSCGQMRADIGNHILALRNRSPGRNLCGGHNPNARLELPPGRHQASVLASAHALCRLPIKTSGQPCRNGLVLRNDQELPHALEQAAQA